MQKLLIIILLFVSTANAETWKLNCEGNGYSNKTDIFEVVMDPEKNLLFIQTPSSGNYPFLSDHPEFSTDLGAIDPIFHVSEFSSGLKIVKARPSTYNYFTGEIVFFLEAGLRNMTQNVEFKIGGSNSTKHQIAVEYDDGDGFGFDIRTYTCAVTEY